MSLRRKLALAAWTSPREPNIYGKLTFDATNAIAYLEEVRKETGKKITITHLVGKALGLVYRQAPTMNSRILWSRFIPFKTIDLSFLVSLEGGRDLAKVKVCEIDQKTLSEIHDELTVGSQTLKAGKDKNFNSAKGMIHLLPAFLLRPILFLVGWLTGALGVNAKALGLEAFPFGSCIITSVGMFGIQEGYAPPTPFARVPLYIVIGKVAEQPAVKDGKLVVQPTLNITFTADHRFIDGHEGSTLAKILKDVIESPKTALASC